MILVHVKMMTIDYAYNYTMSDSGLITTAVTVMDSL